jgi:hypothetical protein
MRLVLAGAEALASDVAILAATTVHRVESTGAKDSAACWGIRQSQVGAASAAGGGKQLGRDGTLQ